MKTFKFFILLAFIATLSGCIVDRHYAPDVKACFTVSNGILATNKPVYFVNCSKDAVSFNWDFGDGFSSNQKNPTHVYSQPGTYQVRMTANGYDSFDSFTDAVTIGGSTDLNILVMYAGTEDPVSNCQVELYDTEANWQNLINPVSEKLTTGQNGEVVFYGLSSIEYYIDAYKPVNDTSHYSNFFQGYATLPLKENQVNYYNIYLELIYGSAKSVGRKEATISYVKKSSKEAHERIIRQSLIK